MAASCAPSGRAVPSLQARPGRKAAAALLTATTAQGLSFLLAWAQAPSYREALEPSVNYIPISCGSISRDPRLQLGLPGPEETITDEGRSLQTPTHRHTQRPYRERSRLHQSNQDHSLTRHKGAPPFLGYPEFFPLCGCRVWTKGIVHDSAPYKNASNRTTFPVLAGKHNEKRVWAACEHHSGRCQAEGSVTSLGSHGFSRQHHHNNLSPLYQVTASSARMFEDIRHIQNRAAWSVIASLGDSWSFSPQVTESLSHSWTL